MKFELLSAVAWLFPLSAFPRVAAEERCEWAHVVSPDRDGSPISWYWQWSGEAVNGIGNGSMHTWRQGTPPLAEIFRLYHSIEWQMWLLGIPSLNADALPPGFARGPSGEPIIDRAIGGTSASPVGATRWQTFDRTNQVWVNYSATVTCSEAPLSVLPHLNCAACVSDGGYWCGRGSLCLSNLTRMGDEDAWRTQAGLLREGDLLLCPERSSWTASACTDDVASRPAGFVDPMYDAQSWVYEMIDVEAVWRQGYTGRGVQVVVNDDGIDLTLPDFGPLPDGSLKFDVAGSYAASPACIACTSTMGCARTLHGPCACACSEAACSHGRCGICVLCG